ncbi:MAG: hypothetical protein GEU97_09315 [Actinophytocola sp.]|nr:hypothetical protein [Actinophytocola sp.]
MGSRPLTQRERAVLATFLAVDFPGVEVLRHQATEVYVVSTCGCGCPSVEFHAGRGLGMTARVTASVRHSDDGLFLYTIEDPQYGEVLGGIEWVGVGQSDPREFPSPDLLDVEP